MEGPRRSGRLSRVLATYVLVPLLLLGAVAVAVPGALSTLQVPDIVAQYHVSVETTRARVRSNRLVVDLGGDLNRPFDASVEESMYVELSNVPDVMRQAVLLSEDSRFFAPYRRIGLDPLGTAIAAASGFKRGGSSLTQQLAKNLYTGSERGLKRKFKEWAIAFWLERHMSKDELFELYLNTPFMGENVRGIEAAARRYFGYSFKVEGSQKPFTPMMAAQLAVTIRDPTHGNPGTARNGVRARRLLDLMGLLPGPPLPTSRAQALRAPPPTDHRLDSRFQFARDLAIREIAADLAPAVVARLRRSAGDAGVPARVDVTTAYDSAVQLYVERAIGEFGGTFQRAGYDQLYVYVVNNETGGIEAMVAPPAPDFYPGSTVKPFIALCAITDGGLRPDTLVKDDGRVGVPPVQNADHRYLGPIPLGEALAKSRNPPFVRLLGSLGDACPNAALAGLGSPYRFGGGSLRQRALGAEPAPLMDILQAYVAIASCGRIAGPPRVVEEIRSRQSGEILYRHEPKRADPPSATLRALDRLHDMLTLTAAPGGTAEGSRFVGRQIAAKTGTADNNRQVTLVTFTARYTVLVSVGVSNPAKGYRPLYGHDLVDMVRKLNANIHIGHAEKPLGCSADLLVSDAR